MDLLRSLLIPLNIASLLFVGISGLILSFVLRLGLFAVFPVFILLIWLFKYCYVMLEHVANGGRDAPVVAVEMLSPMEVRPWVQMGLAAAVFLAVQGIGGNLGTTLGIVALLLLPASAGAMGSSGNITDAFNPLALWRMVYGLSYYYLFILALIAAVVFLAIEVIQWPMWLSAKVASLELMLLAIFSFIGGAIYARRVPLGYEPRRSPERALAKKEQERVKQRQQMLDEVFQCVNSRHYPRAGEPVKAWLGAADEANLNEDAEFIAAAATQWRNRPGTIAVMRALIGWFIGAGKPAESLLIFRKALEYQPDFTLDSEPQTLALAQYANSTGQPLFALQMLSRFEQQHPAMPLSEAAIKFRQQLQVRTTERRDHPQAN